MKCASIQVEIYILCLIIWAPWPNFAPAERSCASRLTIGYLGLWHIVCVGWGFH